MKSWTRGVWAVAALTAGGCIGEETEPTASVGALVDGELADPDPEGSVALHFQIDRGLCSATRVTERWLVSAAHCFRDDPWMAWSAEVLGPVGSTVRGVALNACFRHPDARSGSDSTDCDDQLGDLDTGSDLALLHLDPTVDLSALAVRSLRPPPYCAGVNAVEARGVGFTPRPSPPSRTSRLALADVSGSWFAGSLTVATRPPAAFTTGDSGGGIVVAGRGLVAVTSGGSPVGGLVPVANVAPIGLVPNREWIWATLDGTGACTLGSAGPCVLRLPSPLGGDRLDDGLCTGSESPLTLPAECEPALADSDGDGLPDLRDLCPQLNAFDPRATIADGNHTDVDLDGIGDDCEALFGCNPCSPDTDGDFVVNSCDNCDSVPNTDQAECAPGVGLACAPDVDRDRVPDGCDNCPGPSLRGFNPDQANCNVDAEIATLGREGPGDHCDPTPCADTRITTRIERRGSELHGVDDRIEVDGVASVDATARTGFRFCRCAAATDDTVESRNACRGAAAGGCAIARPDLYMPEDPSEPYREVTFDYGPGPFLFDAFVGSGRTAEVVLTHSNRPDTVASFSGRASPRWDVQQDLDRWLLLFPLETSGPTAPGVLWSHTPGDRSMDFADRTLPSHYWSGNGGADYFLFEDPTCIRSGFHFVGGSIADPTMPPGAPLGPTYWLLENGLPDAPFCSGGLSLLSLALPGGTTPAAGFFPSQPDFSSPSLRWVAPAEPGALIGEGHDIRFVAVSLDGTTVPDILVQRTNGTFVPRDRPACVGQNCPCPFPPCQRVCPFPPCDLASSLATAPSMVPAREMVVLSAMREELFLVGTEVRTIDLASGARRTLDLGPVTLGTPLAATYEYVRDSLFVIDEISTGRRGRHRAARLVAIDATTGSAEVVAEWTRGGLTSRFGLAAGTNGSLYLVASGDRGPHFVVSIDPDEGHVRPVALGRDPLLIEGAHASRAEITFVVERRRSVGVEAVRLDGDRWRPHDPSHHCF